ncbi:hypothetical protein [Allonocardiopsis opalescens]|uniref:hypothetical protein n=1 Tax=Allonocardiopsis opalescens TaxID=1144618 RepID=UPI0011B1CC39|nr:hypothetical protein [Allonocardiopsis opalescens]
MLVELRLVGPVGVADHGGQVSQGFEVGGDLLGREAGGRIGLLLVELGGGQRPVGVDFVDPLGHGPGIGSGFQCRTILFELGVALRELFLGCMPGELVDRALRLAGGQHAHGRVQVDGVEQAGQPVVQGWQYVLLPQVERSRVRDVVGGGVLVGEGAAVVRLVVVPTALHPPSAQ